MVHGITPIRCKHGHYVVGFDSNECGCHHDGNPCVIMFCEQCSAEGKVSRITIPIHPDFVDEVKHGLEGK